MHPSRITLLLLIALVSVEGGYAASKTAQEENDLIGPVRTVTTRMQGFSVTETYEREGQLIDAVIHLDHDNSSTHYTFGYDAQGDIQEELATDSAGGLVYRKVFAHAYDDAAREIAEVSASSVGEFHQADFSTYDHRGQLAEHLFIGGMGSKRNVFDVLGRLIYSAWFRDGRLVSELVRTYDAQGRLVRHASYSASGVLTGEDLYQYDEQGRRILTTTQHTNSGGPTRWVTTYEYDDHGNWIKELIRSEGAPTSEPTAAANTTLRERVIEYYPPR